VGIEANSGLVDMCRNKFKNEIQEGKLIIVDKAIHNQSGTIKFYIDQDKDDWGSTIKEWNRYYNKNVRELSVESITLEQIIKEHGLPYYMKINIEGADINCCKSLVHMKGKPKYISLELLAPFNMACLDSLDILSTLKVLGYDKFNIVDQKNNSKTKCPFPSLEGNYYDCHFNEESSGLFGKELSDNWKK
jgi:FkbM family methyltransferase